MDDVQTTLSQPPVDGISSLSFTKHNSGVNASFDQNLHLLVTSWDCSTSLYDVSQNKLKFKYNHHAPVFDGCFIENYNIWSGDASGEILNFDLNTGQETFVAKHDNAVKCLEYSKDINAVISGSWDKTVRLWDPRTRDSRHQFSSTQPDKVYTMACCGHRLIVGTAQKHVLIYDIRNMGRGEEQRRESSLKYQTRAIRAFPNQEGYVLSSIEGRVAVEFFDPSPVVQKKKYAFKCHRTKLNGKDQVHPVYAISFHNHYNTFATGGGDCCVNLWDGMNKKRLCQFQKYPAPVSALAFSPDGFSLAIACSSLYACKENEAQEVKEEDEVNEVFIRKVGDNETKPSKMQSILPPAARAADYSAQASIRR